MPETLIALLFAHVLADFLLQTGWMVRGKTQMLPLLSHIGVVTVASIVMTGGIGGAVVLVAIAHLVTDFIKGRWGGDGLGPFLADQLAHVAAIVVAALTFPLTGGGWWDMAASALPPMGGLIAGRMHLMVLLTGTILAIFAGRWLIEKFMALYVATDPGPADGGLPQGGAAIGLLERALTFLLVIAGQPAGVGFLIAAKSFLRVGSIEKDRQMAEYVIIGTLASIGWALLVAYLTRAALEIVPVSA